MTTTTEVLQRPAAPAAGLRLGKELNAVAVLAYRDLMKFLRDGPRVVATLVFPFAFIGILGGSLGASFGRNSSFDFMAFVFTGTLAQTLFQSSAMGIVSLIADREQDFSQEMFVAPVSRYSIILGKLTGETLVSMAQGFGVLLFGLFVGAGIGLDELVRLLPVALAICFFGGAFGLLILGNLSNQRAANQVFPFVMLPQLFTAGVFSRIDSLPPALDILSRISPMRYAVDLTRGVFYMGRPDYGDAVAASPLYNGAVVVVLFLVFFVAGTALFVRRERNR